MYRSILCLLSAVAVAAAALPLHAQTPDNWMNQKISDLRRAQGEISSPAGEQLDMASRHLATIQRLLEKEDLSDRQQRKLDKAYERAAGHLEEAIELEPEWLEPRLYLGALHYKVGEYDEAVRWYEEAHAMAPGDKQVESYLINARWHAERQGDGGSGAGPAARS